MMTETDPDRLSKVALEDLLLDPPQQIAKLPVEDNELRVIIDRSKLLPVTALDTAQPRLVERKTANPGSQKNSDHGLAQVFPGRESPLPPQPERISGIKPKWKTKNRLQNCHKPRPK